MLKLRTSVFDIKKTYIVNKFFKSYIATTSIKCNSTKVQSASKQDVDQKQEKINFEDIVTVNTKIKHPRLEARSPLVKNFFMNIVDTHLIAYPESLDREEQSTLNKEKEYYDWCFQEKGSAGDRLKNAGYFGSKIPLDFGGKDWTETELSVLTEAAARDFPTAISAMEHNSVAETIVSNCSNQIKDKYLRGMAVGDVMATIAMCETQTSPKGLFNTKAVYDDDKEVWVVNGEKSYILNGKDASLMLVICDTETRDSVGNYQSEALVLLVDANSEGITKSKPNRTVGYEDSLQINVSFKNVLVPAANIVGKKGMGTEIVIKLLQSHRIKESVLGIHIMKNLINYLADYCISSKAEYVSITEMEIVKERLARGINDIFAAESMLYMTTSLMDDFVNQDVEVEAALTKIFTAESLLNLATSALNFIGPKFLNEDNEINKYFRHAIQFYGQGESLDSLKLYTVTSALQFCGMQMHEIVKKGRNPAMNPGFTLTEIFRRTNIDKPKRIHNLNHYLHPTLTDSAMMLEEAIFRLNFCLPDVLYRHGSEVIDKHLELVRLCDIAMKLYAMFCVLSRSSRSYCIGLQHAEKEVFMSTSFTGEKGKEIYNLSKDLYTGPYATNDIVYNKLAEQLFKSKGYFAVHPLTKNF